MGASESKDGESRGVCGSLWGGDKPEDKKEPTEQPTDGAPKKKKGPMNEKAGQSAGLVEDDAKTEPTRVNKLTGSARRSATTPGSTGGTSGTFVKTSTGKIVDTPVSEYERENIIRKALGSFDSGNLVDDFVNAFVVLHKQHEKFISVPVTTTEIDTWVRAFWTKTVAAQPSSSSSSSFSSAGAPLSWTAIWKGLCPEGSMLRDSLLAMDSSDPIELAATFTDRALEALRESYFQDNQGRLAEAALELWKQSHENFVALYNAYATEDEKGIPGFSIDSYERLCVVWSDIDNKPLSEGLRGALQWRRVFGCDPSIILSLDEFRQRFFGIGSHAITTPETGWPSATSLQVDAKSFPLEDAAYYPRDNGSPPAPYRTYGPIRPWHIATEPAATRRLMRLINTASKANELLKLAKEAEEASSSSSSS